MMNLDVLLFKDTTAAGVAVDVQSVNRWEFRGLRKERGRGGTWIALTSCKGMDPHGMAFEEQVIGWIPLQILEETISLIN